MSEKFYRHKNFWDLVQQTILPIFAIADNEIIPLWTWFIIMSNGLMMTARHVIEDFLKEKVQKRDSSGYYNNVWLYVMYVSDEISEENWMYIWWPRQIINASTNDSIDIAIFWLQWMYKDNEPFLFNTTAKLHLWVPKVDSNILWFWYHSSKGEFTWEVREGKTIVNYSQETVLTEWIIEEIIWKQWFRNFPHFQTNARFEPGMSWGPVFIENWSVCGVICSSVKGMTDETWFISYVSLLWPSVMLTTMTRFSEWGDEENVSIYELIKKWFIHTDESIDNIQSVMNPNWSTTVLLKQPKS